MTTCAECPYSTRLWIGEYVCRPERIDAERAERERQPWLVHVSVQAAAYPGGHECHRVDKSKDPERGELFIGPGESYRAPLGSPMFQCVSGTGPGFHWVDGETGDEFQPTEPVPNYDPDPAPLKVGDRVRWWSPTSYESHGRKEVVAYIHGDGVHMSVARHGVHFLPEKCPHEFGFVAEAEWQRREDERVAAWKARPLRVGDRVRVERMDGTGVIRAIEHGRALLRWDDGTDSHFCFDPFDLERIR